MYSVSLHIKGFPENQSEVKFQEGNIWRNNDLEFLRIKER